MMMLGWCGQPLGPDRQEKTGSDDGWSVATRRHLVVETAPALLVRSRGCWRDGRETSVQVPCWARNVDAPRDTRLSRLPRFL